MDLKPISVKKLILKICKLSGGGYPQFGKIPLRKDEIIKLYPNLSKMKKKVGWFAKVDLEKGLKKPLDISVYNYEKIILNK